MKRKNFLINKRERKKQRKIDQYIDNDLPKDKIVLRDSFFSIPLGLLNEENIKQLKNELTIKSNKKNYITKEPIPPSKIYDEVEDRIRIPKNYGYKFLKDLKLEYINKEEKGEDAMTLKGIELELDEENRNQITAYNITLKALLDTGGATLSLPPGDGKTEVALKITEAIGKKVCVIFYGETILQEWKNRVPKRFKDAKVGCLMSDIYEYENYDVVCVSVSSLINGKYDRDIMKKFGFTIIDEAHHESSIEWSKCFRYICSPYILALSGTPKRNDGKEVLLERVIGPVTFKSQRVYKKNVIVNLYELKYTAPKCIRLNNGEINTSRLLTNLGIIKLRNEQIIKQMGQYAETGRQMLILSDRIKQLKILKYYAFINYPNIKTSLLIGGMKTNEQEEAKTCQWIFSTYKKSGEGLDIKSLSIIVLTTPKTNIEQAVSRIFRDKNPEFEPIIIDFYDDYYNWPRQFYNRLKYFKKEKFTINFLFNSFKYPSLLSYSLYKN